MLMVTTACGSSDSTGTTRVIATSSTTAEEARAIDGPLMRYQETSSASGAQRTFRLAVHRGRVEQGRARVERCRNHLPPSARSSVSNVFDVPIPMIGIIGASACFGESERDSMRHIFAPCYLELALRRSARASNTIAARATEMPAPATSRPVWNATFNANR